jgi:HPt (histidine-containing phosphotransfer) domain-containing protein
MEIRVAAPAPPSHEPQYEAQEEEIIAMPPPQYAQDDAVNKADEDVTPLHKFLQEQEQAPAEKMDFSTVFDVKMLDGLLRSLGKDQLIELLDGFIQKTDEIVAKMLAASAGSNNEGVYESAHELRGMAANFGMKELAAIANIIEKAMHNNQPEKAAPEIEKLPGAAETTKAAIRNWLS